MWLSELSLVNFRNIERTTLNFTKNFNLIVGKNAQGKTNILESICILTSLKSFRTSFLKETINNDEIFSDISGVFKRENVHSKRKIKILKDSKQLLLEGKKIKNAVSFIDNTGVISLSVTDTELIYGSPSFRRRFFDKMIFNINRRYISSYRSFYRVLQHKNSILRNEIDYKKKISALELWNQKFSEYAVQIIYERKRILNLLNEKFQRYYNQFNFFSDENIKIVYKSKNKISDSSDITKESFFNNINCESEIKRGTSLIGPHVDDYEFFSEKIDSKAQLSQGQIKGVMLALKLSEMEIFYDTNEYYPMMIFDDLSSELDLQRREILLEKLAEINTQVFISTTDIQTAKFPFKNQEVISYIIESGQANNL